MISRGDLTPAHQALQATHAAIELTKLVDLQRPSLVHVTCRDGPHLEELITHLRNHGITVGMFEESYKNWGLTAISCALKPEQRHLLSHLPLWKP